MLPTCTLRSAGGRRLRIDGVLVPLQKEPIMTPEIGGGHRWRARSRREQKAKLITQRQIDFAYSFEDKARFRVNVYFQRGYLAAALRLVPARIKTIEELNLPPLLHDFAKLSQGFILVVGPAGHGKSSTLAAILDEMNHTRSDHIITIEDPVEYLFTQDKCIVSQREVGSDTTSFHAALRTVLRQDPDVVMIGEMRDAVSIATAMTAAETGHLVLSTLHTNSASQTIDRIIDSFPAEQQGQVTSQLAATLVAIVSERLLPAHLRRPHSRDGDHDREPRHPEPHPRAENLPDRPCDRDVLAGRHGDAEPLARESREEQRDHA